MTHSAGARCLSAVLLLGLVALIPVSPVLAKTVAQGLQSGQFPAGQVFVFLFLMLGPLKIVAPFARITQNADARLTRQIAGRATLFACAALAIAGVVGENQLTKYGIPVPVLALAAGIILFLVALIGILHQYDAGNDGRDSAPAAPTLRMAMVPLAIPTIITPHGVATFVVFLAIAPGRESQLAIAELAALVMLINLLVMLTARRMMPVLAVLLPILGGVFGVIQVALGLLIILNALAALGLLPSLAA